MVVLSCAMACTIGGPLTMVSRVVSRRIRANQAQGNRGEGDRESWRSSYFQFRPTTLLQICPNLPSFFRCPVALLEQVDVTEDEPGVTVSRTIFFFCAVSECSARQSGQERTF